MLLGVAVFIYTGVSLAVHTPLALRGPDISLAPEVLPYYVSLSVGRMAGASAIPKDLQSTADLLQLGRWTRWRLLILPALFPYLITGAITASGGAWNASIIAEYFEFGGQTRYITGVCSLIAQATAAGAYPLLLAATPAMIVTVTTINRFVWRRLYRLAEQRFRRHRTDPPRNAWAGPRSLVGAVAVPAKVIIQPDASQWSKSRA